MNDAKNLRKLLEQTNDKLSIFANRENLANSEFTIKDLYDLIRDFLSDKEKLKLFDYSHFIKLQNNIKSGIIRLVSDENILLQIITNDNIINGFKSYEIVNIMEKLSDIEKQQLLHNQEFIEKYKIANYELKDIISSLTDKSKTKILMDIDLIKNQLHLENFQITDLVNELSSENAKDKAIELYEFSNHYKINIIKTYSNSHKLDILLKENDFYKSDIINILQTLDIEPLCQFLREHKEFRSKNTISPYEITHKLDNEKQKEFIANLENINFTLNEKREILATLNPDIKQNIDTTNFAKEYKSALSIQTTECYIDLDLDRNLEDYRGLDKLMRICPEKYTEEQKAKFIQLCNICPNLEIISTLNETNNIGFISNSTEYKEAEEWIDSIINNLNPEYSKAQKLAVIDNAIGKKISYSPDFDTEVFNKQDCRALWKIISY